MHPFPNLHVVHFLDMTEPMKTIRIDLKGDFWII